MSATQTAESSRQLVVFELSRERYALPIEQVQEIIRYSDPRHVASDSPWIRGVINLRGKIVPVCDLAARIGAPADDSHVANIIVVETPEGTAGLIVNQVTEVLTIDADQVESTPAASDPAVRDIAKVSGHLVVLLDPAALLVAHAVA